MASSTTRTAVLTLAALVAFAGNSLLCRAALGPAAIDPVSFTTVRLVSGAGILLALTRTRPETTTDAPHGSWISALALFVYAMAFSWAYVSLTTGTGALILFGSVQATMIGAGLIAGERPSAGEWLGMTAAVGGLVYLVLPGISAPPLLSAALMAGAGIAWGVYSLRGRSTVNPTASTAGNFVRSAPITVVFSVLAFRAIHVTGPGFLLAATSGALTSGLGYALWYAALRGHSATSAAVVQLTVPAIAALAGVVFLDETLSLRLVLSGFVTLGGIAVAIAARRTIR